MEEQLGSPLDMFNTPVVPVDGPGINSLEYRALVDAAKERIRINLEIMRKEYPHWFA